MSFHQDESLRVTEAETALLLDLLACGDLYLNGPRLRTARQLVRKGLATGGSGRWYWLTEAGNTLADELRGVES